MLKKKATWKLAAGCLASAVAIAAAVVFAADSGEIQSAEPEQNTTVSQSAPVSNETAAYSVPNYDAAQTQKLNFAQKKTDGVGLARYNSAEVTTAAALKSETAQINGAKAPQQTTAATTKATMPYIYDGYVPSSAYTTAATKITTKKAVVTTTAKPAAVTTKAAAKINTAATGSPAKPAMIGERTYDTDYTHPYNKQTSQIKVHWNAVSGAAKYKVFVKNGQYSNWTNVATTTACEYLVSGLRRDTSYAFAVQAVDASGKTSELSAAVNIKTARMDYSAAGWQAMCRIVYHEVGGAAGSFWDKPIVYVADCVANQYVCAKYTLQGVWPKYYSRYPSVESVIYTSGGFLSDANLTARGATYTKVTERVKKAVWGAVYGVTYYAGIANDYNIFYWSNSATAKSDSRIAYGYKLPWGSSYMYIWRQYWG
ncbi:MAG: fibronectin type III domain-containing protein [Ruminococcus sp.]|nr:fibronectin type III domain-containing protein [Ruminococcus sp.]